MRRRDKENTDLANATRGTKNSYEGISDVGERTEGSS